MVIICLRKISNIRECVDSISIDNEKNFVKKIFQFFDFYLLEKKVEKKISIVKNIIVVLIFFVRYDRQFSWNSLKNYFSDEPKWMINYLLEILQTNVVNNHFTDLTDYFYYKDCNIYWQGSKIPEIPQENSSNFSLEEYKISESIEKINNSIYEKNYNPENIQTFPNNLNNNFSYWSGYSNNNIGNEKQRESLLDQNYEYSRIYEEFIAKIGEPKNYLTVFKQTIIKEAIVFIQISVLGYEKIVKINIPYTILINHFYRVVENSNTSIDYEILVAFIRIIKKYGEKITDEWSDIFKILNIIIRREDNKNSDKLIKVLYEILDRIKLLIISQKFNGNISEYINFLDEFKTFPYDSLMILKCKYKLNTFLNYISKLESVIIENLIKYIFSFINFLSYNTFTLKFFL